MQQSGNMPSLSLAQEVPPLSVWRRLQKFRREMQISRLPARVQASIRQQQDRSELLIGWIQLGVTLIFASLYAVAPAPVNQVEFRPVPWFLASYFVFTVVRLYLAARRSLPSWYLALSVVVDITLLVALIASFHLQYGQPASFVLKSPTLLYVFIFIALRALRFEARWVVLVGCVAALEWLGLVAYVIFSDPAGNRITHDYVAYLTSNSVLIGAEFDKVVAILVVTGIMALSISLARRLLVTAVVERSASQELARFFSPEVAIRITRAENRHIAGHGEFRRAAVLNFDIRGFTQLARTMPTPDVMTLLAEYQALVVPIVTRHNGTIDKFLGDGIMATFGATVVSDQYLADALRAVDGAMAAVEAWSERRSAAGLAPVRVGAAVAADQVIFGVVGDDSRLEYTVIGDAVNLCARLEKHTKWEKVRALTTLPAYEEACRQGYEPGRRVAVREGRAVPDAPEPLDLVVLWS